MKKLNSFFLSSILYKKVYDEYGDFLGKLWDIYVTTEDSYPKAIGYKIKKDGEMFNYEFRNIDFYEENSKVSIKVKDAKEIIPRSFSYLLSKHLLDKQIVDINGKKLVRVNDLRMGEIAGELRVLAVDTGVLALGRRTHMEKLVKGFCTIMKKEVSDSLIMWDNVESLEMVNNNLMLSVPYQKLSKLHPADLADILEEMDDDYRAKVFESLDENLAADTLEEIEPEIQKDLLESISESKAAEVFDSMPNDEIADILDEVDEETAEKILMSMEKEDAEEIRELMQYEDETVGSIMNKDFIAFNVNITTQETIELLRELKPDNEVAYYIYIVDEDEKLQGIVSLRDLVVSSPDSKLRDIMDTNVIKIRDNEKIEESIELAVKYDLLSLPVVDEEDRLCGIVILSDIIDEVLLPTWRRKTKKVS
ncbi:CBS domain-containing protein [Clostridium sp. SYSU_GA19001]|uniref:magnesium transporter n=1 Tax=Clostridium caldaquaticum TaxID=2940653 RepID=UPI002076FDC2|nr:CBS domain-containing protein [Clostridium caldaquaticum]MCM8711108.1 CBS domain-containing protein [Clostridium caldaquaticum]